MRSRSAHSWTVISKLVSAMMDCLGMVKRGKGRGEGRSDPGSGRQLSALPRGKYILVYRGMTKFPEQNVPHHLFFTPLLKR